LLDRGSIEDVLQISEEIFGSDSVCGLLNFAFHDFVNMHQQVVCCGDFQDFPEVAISRKLVKGHHA